MSGLHVSAIFDERSGELFAIAASLLAAGFDVPGPVLGVALPDG